MPLCDRFRPPLDDVTSKEVFHGGWPMVIVQHLRQQLPAGYVAEPRVRSGSPIEIDVAPSPHADGVGGGVATAAWAPAAASLAVETDLSDYDEYEVRVYDAKRGRQLVAALEIVSPANKDRSEHRNAFVAKCAAPLQEGVAVGIVDLVTVRHFNLYTEMPAQVGHRDPTSGGPPSHIHATSSRWVRRNKRTPLEGWSHVLALGQPLPTLPLWLAADRVVPLDLERSYEQTCHDL